MWEANPGTPILAIAGFPAGFRRVPRGNLTHGFELDSYYMRGFHTVFRAAVLAAALGLARASLAQPADRAAPRTDANSMLAHGKLLEKTRQGRIDVYFEGDSIVRRWGATDYPELLANWNRNFFGWNAADFGWGADKIENILWRLENGELDSVHPKVIVLLAGTNNVGSRARAEDDGTFAAEVARGIEAVVKLMQAKAPDAVIILTAIFPRNDNMSAMPAIHAINELLANLADGKKIRYLNINDQFAGKDGKLFDGLMSPDGLHPTVKGYQVWADSLKPVLEELLGPPAQEDHAPPPTGDPAARRQP